MAWAVAEGLLKSSIWSWSRSAFDLNRTCPFFTALMALDKSIASSLSSLSTFRDELVPAMKVGKRRVICCATVVSAFKFSQSGGVKNSCRMAKLNVRAMEWVLLAMIDVWGHDAGKT